MIKYSNQTIDKSDIRQVTNVLKSDYLTQGPKVPEFERQINIYTSSKYSVAVNSASSGLFIACKALGLKKNDYIWTVPNTFAATANSILLSGYKIDFVDIDNKTWNLSLDILKKKLKVAKKKKKLPKAVIVVHLAGLPFDPKQLKNLSKKYNFKIIEDAAHSIGSNYYNKKVGSCFWSDLTVFSFHPVKIITTIEGGCVTTNNRKYFKKMKLLRNNGITNDKKFFKKKAKGPWYYEQQDLGFNFRMNDVQAALGINQLKKIDYFVKKRNNIAKSYKKKLANLPIVFQEVKNIFLSSYHLFIIQINKKIHKTFFNYMRKNNIFVNLHYLPLHLHPYYKKLGYKKNDYPNSEKYSECSISIPIYPNLTNLQQNKIVSLIKKFFKKKK